MRVLLIDDFRYFNCDKTARNYDDGIKYLQQEIWDEVLLDHDLGACKQCTEDGIHIGDMKTPETTFYNSCPHAKTGYDILCWLENNKQFLPKKITLVTANPVGRKNMESILIKLFNSN
jgi:hypothetical protein